MIESSIKHVLWMLLTYSMYFVVTEIPVSACFSMAASWTLRHSVKASTKIFDEIVMAVSKRMQATDINNTGIIDEIF